MEWTEIPGTFISRNCSRYGSCFGAIILIPKLIHPDELIRYSDPESPGLLSYIYPNPMTHVQGLPSVMRNAEIIWEFSRYGPIKGFSRSRQTEDCVWIEYVEGIHARNAIVKMHGIFLHNQDIEVKSADRALKGCAGGTYWEQLFTTDGYQDIECRIYLDIQRGFFII